MVGDNLFKIWFWHKDNSPSLCIIDTALRNRVSVKIGDIIFEMDMLIIGGQNTTHLHV